MIFRGDD